MYVENVTGNKLLVKRAQDKTPLQTHLLGAKVYTITQADNVLIQTGDDFGFDGNIF